MAGIRLVTAGLVLTGAYISFAHADDFHMEKKNLTKSMVCSQTTDGYCQFSISLHKGGKSNSDIAWTTSGYTVPWPETYESHLMYLRLTTTTVCFLRMEFQLLYSFHHRFHRPVRVTRGLWNCSTPVWPDFERHFRCNLDVECEAGEDEAPCFYVGHCGQDYLTLNGSCYSYVHTVDGYDGPTWRGSSLECQLRGGYLASLNTPSEWNAVVSVLKSRVFKIHVHIGLTESTSMFPEMYKSTFTWVDKSVAFYLDIDQISPRKCGYFKELKFNAKLFMNKYCDHNFFTDAICEFDNLLSVNVGSKNTPIHFHTPQNDSLAVPAVKCSSGHVTFDFLVCDEQSACWSSRRNYIESEEWGVPSRASCPAPMTPLPAMFKCSRGFLRIPYSLVCDHRQQCADNSDESFCVFPPCSGSTPLTCAASTQCVPLQSSCNGKGECLDGADEVHCQYFITDKKTLPPPAVVNFLPIDGTTDFPFVITALPQRDQQTDKIYPCPETHFQCPDNGYCIPVYVRCNGVNDCPGREDEAACHIVSCPGFYRCRSSRICLHPSHVCNSLYQCPQQDDELFCDLKCPPGCMCHGLAFRCFTLFHAERHLDVRFVDASGSGMTPADLRGNTMLIHLSLSRCGLDNIYNMSFPNLCSLNLNDNNINIITIAHLSGMMNLQFLTLSNNPLKSLFPPSSKQFSVPVIKTLHLSGVTMRQLNTRIFSPFPHLQTLNLSHCAIDGVAGGGFPSMSEFRILDIAGCPLTQFPRDLLSRLDRLQAVYAENFKVCCPDTLPTAFNLANCRAPFDEVSSCESLLRSDVYTVFLSIFATLTLIGNLGCFVLRRSYLKSGTSGFPVFVTHLSVSDFLMGVYLTVIGVADRIYKGDYQWEDFSWRHSTACKVAGFLSLLSNEVSAFIICLITLDRFFVLRFPFSNLHFKARSAHLTSLVVWVVAVVIGVVPLTPMTSQWSFYSHTGICIPLPVTRRDFAGRQYAFGILIVCNFILFVFIAIGQAAIYFTVRANSLSTTDSTKKSNDLRLARRLISVAVSDFLCWFPVGLVGLLASSGVPISGEVNVSMAILVLPLNSAINPFLYTINIVMERRRRSRDEYLLKQLTIEVCEEEHKTG